MVKAYDRSELRLMKRSLLVLRQVPYRAGEAETSHATPASGRQELMQSSP